MPSTARKAPDASIAYRQDVDDVIKALKSDVSVGLTDDDARARLQLHGHNELTAEMPVRAWRRFLAQFRNVLVILLLIATAVSAALWAVERDAAFPYEAIAIFAVVLLNAMMGYVQESRAESAVAALRAMSAADAIVMRAGERRSIPATDIVPGDIILIEEGDTIPADARVMESTALQTAEAALTGESLPVMKETAPIAGEAALGDRHNMLFSGTAATPRTRKGRRDRYRHAVRTGADCRTLEGDTGRINALQRELDRARPLGSWSFRLRRS